MPRRIQLKQGLPSITVRPLPSAPEKPLPASRIRAARGPEALSRNIANEAELEDNMLRIHSTGRPKNTGLAYTPKQSEFRAFCKTRGFVDSDTVTKRKLLLFLSQEVVQRRRSRKVAASTPLSKTRLHWKSVWAYVSAVTDLWQQQRTLGMNNHPSPREGLAQSFIRTLQQTDAEQNRATFADKGQDTLLDGYSEPELRLIAQELWAKTAENPGSAELLLRTLTDLLLSHYMLSRGDHRRAAEISDFFTFEFPGEGPTLCMPLIFTTRAGKTNQHGRLETSAALRSRDADICLLGAVGFYLLYRWDLSSELFPDFGSPEQWYNTRLLKATSSSSQPEAGLSYSSQWTWISRAFDYAGVISGKKAHAGRSSGAKTAELRGVSESQIQRAGHWNPDQMVGCYLTSLPRKFMRSIAGHPPQMGCFNLPRAIPPPAPLLSMIWPELDQWVESLGGQKPADLAGNGFVQLLLYLREVILQDSAFLIDQYPGSPVWTHPVFRHPEYRPFARRVLAQASSNREPDRYTLLSQALPEFTEHLMTTDARQTARTAELSAAVATLTAEVTGLRAELSTRLQTTFSEAIFRMQLPGAGAGSGAGLGSGSGSGSGSEFQHIPEPLPAPPAIPDIDPALIMQAEAVQAGEAPPQHRMSRAVKTIEALWQEWMAGLPGQPAISALDSRWGSRWRAGRQSELQWYSLRAEVFREIRYRSQAQGISEVSAMHAVALEHRQTSQSLDAFCKHLRTGRKLREAARRKH